MISARENREHLSKKPFQPCRVYLSDGSKHDVPHPEFAWVFGDSLFVGKTDDLPYRLGDFVRQLSILHVTRLEPMPRRAAKSKMLADVA